MKDPKAIGECFEAGGLKSILIKARQLSVLDQQLHRILPTDIAPHCRVMNLVEKTLILEVDNAAWATRIRYLVPNLLADLTPEADINDIQCRVRYR